MCLYLLALFHFQKIILLKLVFFCYTFGGGHIVILAPFTCLKRCCCKCIGVWFRLSLKVTNNTASLFLESRANEDNKFCFQQYGHYPKNLGSPGIGYTHTTLLKNLEMNEIPERSRSKTSTALTVLYSLLHPGSSTSQVLKTRSTRLFLELNFSVFHR